MVAWMLQPRRMSCNNSRRKEASLTPLGRGRSAAHPDVVVVADHVGSGKLAEPRVVGAPVVVVVPVAAPAVLAIAVGSRGEEGRGWMGGWVGASGVAY